jgi:DNA repair protein RecO (recombination protein O)
MSTEKSDAIVIRSVAWSETSLIVTLFTRSFGKVSAVAKGARRLKSPFETSLDLLAKSETVFILKSSETLDILTESKLIRRFRSGQRSLLAWNCGFYLAELVFSLTENHLAMPHVFDALDLSLEKLDEMGEPAKIVLSFEMEFLRELGHLPSFELCAGCGNSVQSGRNRRYLFGIEAGGLLCDRCLAGQRHVLTIHEPTVLCLREVASGKTRADDWQIQGSVRGEVRFVMERFISYLADRQLRLMEFLEELKR